MDLARESLRKLLDNDGIPDSIRLKLKSEYNEVNQLLDKLENGHLHVAVFGRVSVGKSSVLNALIGRDVFSTSILHGETKVTGIEAWQEYQDGGIFLLDTPGINEIDGEEREAMAHEVVRRSDLVLFVIDSDLTDVEMSALKLVADGTRPIILVVNKSDQYSNDDQLSLRQIIRKRVKDLIASANIIFAAAQPAEQKVVYVAEDGTEKESVRAKPIDIVNLKARLWDILESEGKTLSALNASIFAGDLSEKLGSALLEARSESAEKIIKTYCIGKGVAVAINPIPVADLVAAAAVDVSMIVHLSRLYNLPMTKVEAGELIKTIAAQMLILYGTVWAVNFISSALKLGTGGLSTVITAAAQGAIAYYSTLVIGQVAERYLAKGKSWGDAGPKFVVSEILDHLDRDSVISEAREEILAYLRKKAKK
ncbi:MAG: GTP-binding protein [Thiotrichaceae bacterium]|nr:GTP-binding protein [Thiotrichaceae bacterium]